MPAPQAISRFSHLAAVFGILIGWSTAWYASAQPASSVPDRLHVLFIGDDGHHEPAVRVRQILPFMAGQGIDIFYTKRLSTLDPDVLNGYDVVMLYANHPHLSAQREQALLGYVAEGGGLVAVHCASAMFSNSDAYISLVGGAFKSHGADSFRTEIIRSDHPAIQGVPNFASWDETYVHTKHNPDKEVLSVRRSGNHEEPWTWVRTHGEGRVFYTAWGHDLRTWSKSSFHELLNRGIRWAAGDGALTADFARPELEYGFEGSIPYYPPGVGWGVTGDPITRLQEPLTPEASMRQTSLRPGFRLELFAAEPDVVNPIDMAWDERGRLWVVETIDYPNDFKPDRRGEDRVKILEDTDRDGRADKITVFADSLNIPTSLVLTGGGVIVAQAPDVILLKDTDGDDRADHSEILFTGWGTFDTHAGPNNLRYGFDNHIWGAVGYSGFSGVVGGDSVRLTQGFHRFSRDGTKLEQIALTNNNTWGLGFSEEGLVFGSTANGNPSNFAAIPNRYFAGLNGEFPTSEDEPDRRGNTSVLPPIADDAFFFPITEEVRQVDWHGQYTSGASHELYTARRFPREYWNRAAFVGGPTGHLLGSFFLEPEGSGFRAVNDANLIASRDAWFAPIQARVGPDGALWFIDWYNLIIQHNPTPPGAETGEGNAYENELRDRQHSRIYRIVHDGAPEADGGPSDLSEATPAELVRTLSDDNMHWRLTAQRLLVERGQLDVLPNLYPLVEDERVDELGLNPGAIHALWTMHGLGALDGGNDEAVAVAVAALRHPSAGVQRAALMVLPPTLETFEAILSAGLLPDRSTSEEGHYVVPSVTMTATHPQVRLATLLAVADMEESDRAGNSVAELVLVPENARDRWLREASIIAGARHSRGFLQRMLRGEPGPQQRSDSAYVADLSEVVGRVAAHSAAETPPDFLVEMVTGLGSAEPVLAEAFVEGLAINWPDGEPPVLTAVQRAAVAAVAENASEAMIEHLRALAARWKMSDLLD